MHTELPGHRRPHHHRHERHERHDGGGGGTRSRRPAGRDRGQATTEYALVLLAAALVGVLVIGWATSGGGAAAIGRLFDAAIDAVIDQV